MGILCAEADQEFVRTELDGVIDQPHPGAIAGQGTAQGITTETEQPGTDGTSRGQGERQLPTLREQPQDVGETTQGDAGVFDQIAHQTDEPPQKNPCQVEHRVRHGLSG